MRVHLTYHERRHLRYALRLAIDDRNQVIEAHRVQWRKGPQAYKRPRTIPAEYKTDVQRWRREIAAYQRLLTKLKAAEAAGGEANAHNP